jgi:hypothetical protein
MTSAIFRWGRPIAAMFLLGAMGVMSGCSGEPESLAVEGTAKADKLTQCVEPTDFMRRNHMELIKHQRDETVHKGIRATDNKLASCIECHVRHDKAGRPVPVNAPGEFCAACHQFVGEHLNCYQCHSPVPNDPEPATAQVPDEQAWGGRIAMTDADSRVLHEVQQGKGAE